MRRLVIAAACVCGLLLLAHPAHAQTDNQCQGSSCDSGGGGYNVDSLPYTNGQCDMVNGNICGYGWTGSYSPGQIPTDPGSTVTPCDAYGDCTRYCDQLEQAVNEMGGDMYKFFTGNYTADGEPIYEFYNYYGWWSGWAYYNGAGLCAGGRPGN